MTDQKHKIKAPLKMCEYGGYVWDADNNMVADLVLSDDAKHGFVLRMRGAGRGMTAKDQEDIANRLLDCYNACEGIEDPKDFRGLRKQLKSVTKQRDELREALSGIMEMFKCAECGEPARKHFFTEGDGDYLLCDSQHESHGIEYYAGLDESRPFDKAWAALTKTKESV